jgi:hypothetical protein
MTYNKTYETMKKEIFQKYTARWKDCMFIDWKKMATLPKQSTGSMQFSSKSQSHSSHKQKNRS